MHTILKKKLRGLSSDTVEFASDLVRISSPAGDEGAIGDAVELMMKGLSFDNVFKDDSGNVVGVILGRNIDPALLLCSNMNTGLTADLSSREQEPHNGDIIDGKLYGSGASDSKSGIATQVFAAELLKRSLLPLDGTIIVAATVANKKDNCSGVSWLMEKTLPSLDIKPSYAVLGEPTDLGLYCGYDYDKETQADLITENNCDVWYSDPFHPLMERSRHALTAAGCEMRPGKWSIPRQAMSGGILSSDYGVPTIGYGPGREEKTHASSDECVKISNIENAVYGTAIITQALIGVPVWGWCSSDF